MLFSFMLYNLLIIVEFQTTKLMEFVAQVFPFRH
jgi:hypothetical protein